MSDQGRFYVIGGSQKYNAHGLPEWQRFGRGMVVEVDSATGKAEVKAEYESPPEACPDDRPGFVFKAGAIHGDRLYACTQTEVLVYQLPSFEIINYVSLPCFNDVHHVRPSRNGTMLAAVTGLDMVVEFTDSGEVVNEWNVLGKDPWERFSRDIDYRKVSTTRPHESHPNFVFYLDDEVWVTRFEQRDAVCLTREGGRIPIDVQRPHDGMVHDGRVYHTTVDGHIVVSDAATKESISVHNLNDAHVDPRFLGWCRGLHIVAPGQVIVGFSRLRPTRIKTNLDWTFGGTFWLKGFWKRPARIAMYDLEAGKRRWEAKLEKVGLSVVFSILPVPDSFAAERSGS